MSVSARENLLLAGIDAGLWERVAPWLEERSASPGEVLFRTGDPGDGVYLILEGEVEIVGELGENEQILAVRGEGTYFGEMSLFDGAPRSATARARGDARVALLPSTALDGESGDALVPELLMRHAIEQNRRMRQANDTVLDGLRRELEASRLHERLAVVLVLLVVLFSAYSYAVGLLQEAHGFGLLLASLGVAIGASVGAAVFISMSREPLGAFGLTWAGARRAILRGVLWGAGGVLVATALKAAAVSLFPSWTMLPVVSDRFVGPEAPFGLGSLALRVALYGVSCIVQEFAARSFLQTSLELLLPERGRLLLAVIVSNLLFSVFHLHYSPMFAAVTFGSGLFFGAFWTRQRSLVGVSVFHWIVGSWAIWGLDLLHLPGFSL